MDISRIKVIQSDFSQNNKTRAVLKDGSTVKAHVLSKSTNGFYTISLAGQKISVYSKAELQTGQIFSAKVKIAGDKISLSLISEKPESTPVIQKINTQSQSLSPEIVNFLSSLGLEKNLDSLKILQFMQQIGIKINSQNAKKSLAFSKKNNKIDHEKAQISLLFEEKGIKQSEEYLNAVSGKNHKDNKKNQNNENEAYNLPAFKEKLKKYFQDLDFAADNQKAGILTAFNTILSAHKKEPPLNHWVVFPFEWSFKNSSGDIKLLFDSDLKNLQKVVINIKTSDINRVFSLSYNKNHITSLKFASSDNSENKHINSLPELSFFSDKGIKIEKTDYENLQGFSSFDEELSFIAGGYNG